MPRVSILMLTYNRPQLIGRAIASACEQSFTDWELIIVQDGANPETLGLVSQWLDREPRIRYFTRERVGTIAEASNFGLEESQSEYVAILDDDDSWIDRDKLSRQVEFLDANPEYVGCGGGMRMVDPDGHQHGCYLKPQSDHEIRSRALVANPMANSTTMFRRVVKGKRVIYDIGLRQFADWDFWLTMGNRGRLYNFPICMAQYTLWGGGSSFQAQRQNGRAALAIVRKHRGQYRGYRAALLLAVAYMAYASLPEGFRRVTYSALSSTKKALAGGKQAEVSA